MALRDNISAAIACPACGNAAPHNFEIKMLCTIREMQHSTQKKSKLKVARDFKQIVVCASCGAGIDVDLNG